MRIRLAAWLPPMIAATMLFVSLTGNFWAHPEGDDDHAHHDKLLRTGLIEAAKRGVHLYNDQKDAMGCYRVFEGALLAARPSLHHHKDLQKKIDQALASAESMEIPWQRAHALRKVLDEVSNKLRPKTGPDTKDDGVKDVKKDDVKKDAIKKDAIDKKDTIKKDVIDKKDAIKDLPVKDLPIKDLPIKDVKKDAPKDIKKDNAIKDLPVKDVKKDEVKKDEVKKDEVKKDEVKKDEVKKDNAIKDLPVKDSKDGVKKDTAPKDVKKDNAVKDLPIRDVKKDEAKKDTSPKDVKKDNAIKDLPEKDAKKDIGAKDKVIDVKDKKDNGAKDKKTDNGKDKNIENKDVGAKDKKTDNKDNAAKDKKIDDAKDKKADNGKDKTNPKQELPPNTGAIVGKVTFKGQPLNIGFVTLINKDGRKFTANIQPDGTYAMNKGVPTGSYKVIIEKSTSDPKKGEKLLPIPERYQNAATTPLEARVTAGRQNLNLMLIEIED